MTISSTSQTDLHGLLQTHFGFSQFRLNQEQIIKETLEGKDSLVLMPTGGGKSLCYQLPGLAFEGLTLVISPLIALMHDQIQSLVANGISAAYLNSSLTETQEQNLMKRLYNKEIKLLYVAPERLFSRSFLDELEKLDLSFVAIDEAHCVSTWGHHFRPDYKLLSKLKIRFPDVPVMALTATADRTVRKDIASLLALKEPKIYVSSFDRPNLSLAVLPGQKKWEQLLHTIKKYPGQAGIIYCASRKLTEQLAEKLQKQGMKALPYHAGLASELRRKTQDQFIQGQVDIVCATIAFGMGIDKSDIRFVIHYNMPGNLESLYQEIGRAGRDGLPAETILFYSFRDVQTHLGFIDAVDDDTYRHILKAKLDRIREYAEAQVCRRKILMSYFSEAPGEDCGNCDVCHNPPAYIEGTVEAQKALSAIARSKESLPLTTLVDVLRGQLSSSVKEKGWNSLKTFGKGREHSAFAWQLYLQQMIQQGIMEIDYRDKSQLKLNEVSHLVLAGKEVKLVDFEVIKKRQAEQKQQVKIRQKMAAMPEYQLTVDEELFALLKTKRRELASKYNKPPFIIFADVTLRDMSARQPKNLEEFLLVSGVGTFKAKKYGDDFLQVIAYYLKKRS